MVPNSSNMASAKSLAISSLALFSVSIWYSLATAFSFVTSLISYPWAFPSAVSSSTSSTSRPWSEWDAAPTSRSSSRFLATMVSTSAPQTPFVGPSSSKTSTRQGPIEQLLQQTPSWPKPHCGCCFSSLSQAVSIPSFMAFSIICWLDSSIDLC